MTAHRTLWPACNWRDAAQHARETLTKHHGPPFRTHTGEEFWDVTVQYPLPPNGWTTNGALPPGLLPNGMSWAFSGAHAFVSGAHAVVGVHGLQYMMHTVNGAWDGQHLVTVRYPNARKVYLVAREIHWLGQLYAASFPVRPSPLPVDALAALPDGDVQTLWDTLALGGVEATTATLTAMGLAPKGR